MKSRLNDVPPLLDTKGHVEALHFNAIRVALLRLKPPIRFSLPGLRSLDVVLEPGLWLVVDSGLNDLPVIAWSDFDVSHREALHQPVACRMRFFHSHASLIIGKVLSLTHLELERLTMPTENSGNNITPLPLHADN